MNRRERILVLSAAPIVATIVLVACSDDPAKPSFEDRPDATASLPDAAAPVEDAGIDVHPPEVPTEEPIVCAAKPCVTQLVAGRSHFCALLDDKTVRCWGCGEKALGVYDGGNVSGSYQARPMSMGLSSVEQISAANETTCARLTNGTLSCWGGSQLNELGLDPPRADVAAHGPGLIALDGGAVDGFTRVDVATSGTVFALRASGELWSWGKNVNYMLGRSNEDKTYLSPGPAEDLADMKIVRARGGSFPDRGGIGLAITEKGQLLAWGNSLQMVRYPGPVPFLVENFENVTSVAATTEHVCVVASGRLYCWGRNGLLACTGTTDAALTPVEIETRGTAPVQQVDVHAANTCVKLTDGTIECCGSDDKGQLATGEADGGAGPARLLTRASAFTEHAVQIAVSVQTICALVQGGTVQCWGGNERGELGQGTADTERHPKPVTVTFD